MLAHNFLPGAILSGSNNAPSCVSSGDDGKSGGGEVVYSNAPCPVLFVFGDPGTHHGFPCQTRVPTNSTGLTRMRPIPGAAKK